jgi:lipopolysaccharide transport system permease protein
MIKLRFLKSLIKNRELCFLLSQREIQSKYKGSILGIGWATLNPLIMLCVYTLVFSQVFRTKWNGGEGTSIEFAMNLFAGLIVFNVFSECFNRAPSLITANPNYIKKVRFPIEILGTVVVCSSIFQACISIILMIIVMSAVGLSIKPTILMIPMIWAPMIFLVLGLTWLFAVIGVYFKDLTQITPSITSTLMFLSPIFYPSSALPEKIKWIAKINPIGITIEETRKALLEGEYHNGKFLILSIIISMFICEAVFRFMKGRQSDMGDLL